MSLSVTPSVPTGICTLTFFLVFYCLCFSGANSLGTEGVLVSFACGFFPGASSHCRCLGEMLCFEMHLWKIMALLQICELFVFGKVECLLFMFTVIIGNKKDIGLMEEQFHLV